MSEGLPRNPHPRTAAMGLGRTDSRTHQPGSDRGELLLCCAPTLQGCGFWGHRA